MAISNEIDPSPLGKSNADPGAIEAYERAIALAMETAGYQVHLSQGVWWHQTGPSFSKPVNLLRVIEPGSASPYLRNSFLGFSHVVADTTLANRSFSTMFLDEDALRGFKLEDLGKGRRSAIKKSLKELVFTDITQIEPYLDAMADICISQAIRNGHGRKPTYYTKHRKRWENFMKREFSIPSRVWLGAFSGGRLVGYYYAYLIDGTMYISAAKSHTDALNSRPNDGMLFSLIDRCQADSSCRQIIFGGWSAGTVSLNDFKESFGFRRFDFPVFRCERWPIRLGLRLKSLITRAH